MPHPVLHIYLGLLIQFGICVLLRKRISHPMPLYFVYFAELYNEIHDTLHGAGEINRAFAWGYMLDYLHTIIIPTILFLLARYTSILMRSNTDT
ncbi:MAG: hypothetical protein KGL21_10820 [Alphaproteobacteria bacterium]|nr:hypothetical protein [Alphaproteobacteria bacterium]